MSDPTKISEKHQATVKSYCKSFFDKAAAKHKEREKRKAEKRAESGSKADSTPAEDQDVKMSDDEGEQPAMSPMEDESTLKRKREDLLEPENGHGHGNGNGDADDGSSSPSKRQKSTPPPPPPPPGAPPAEEGNDDSASPIPPTPPLPRESPMDTEMEMNPPQIGIEGRV